MFDKFGDAVEDTISRTERGEPPFLVFLGGALLFLGIVLLVGTVKSWGYHECLKGGNTEAYCQARALGCRV